MTTYRYARALNGETLTKPHALERLELLVARYVEDRGLEAGTFSAERIPPEAVNCHLALLEWWYDGGELSIGDQDRLRRFIAFMRSDATERPTIEQQRVDARAARLAASRRDRESR